MLGVTGYIRLTPANQLLVMGQIVWSLSKSANKNKNKNKNTNKKEGRGRGEGGGVVYCVFQQPFTLSIGNVRANSGIRCRGQITKKQWSVLFLPAKGI
jgi:hypothetical protein